MTGNCFCTLKTNNQLTVEEVMAAMDISRATVFRDYAKIRKKSGITYDKKLGRWIVSVSKVK